MSDKDTCVTDEDLTAFLDEALSEAEHARIEAALEGDPALQRRLEALHLPEGLLSRAYDMAAMEAPQMPAALRAQVAAAATQATSAVTKDMPLPKPANTNKAPAFLWPMALAASFALGMVAMNILQPAPSADLASAKPGWVETVASYQALYTTETLSGATQDPETTQAILARAESLLDVDLAPVLDIDGLTFKRVQMLAIDGAPLVQMAYLDEQGRPFAFCLTMRDAENRDALTKMSWDLAASSWIEDGVGFVLVGGEDETRVGEIAQQFQGLI